MGAVNTTYTFTPTDTITSTKMNNIIDQTVMTADALLDGSGGSGGLSIADGKLTISSGAINSSRLASNSVTTDKIVDGTIVNADINASAAIAGTKISPDFGAQTITTTGDAITGTLYLSRQDASTEGGELQFRKAFDATTAFTVDCQGAGHSPNLRIFGTTGQVATITAAGNVGVNNSNPQTKLHILGSGEILRIDDGVRALYAGCDANEPFCGTLTNHPLRISTNSAERMRITADGNVGIGVTPAVKLDIAGETLIRGAAAAGSIMRITPDATGSNGVIVDTSWITGNAGPLIFKMASTERMRITAAGNVGIGKTNPSTTLDVNGTVTATAFAGPLTGNVTGIASGNIKQGGGDGQLGNNVFIGWDNTKLRVQVDSSSFGSTWPIDINGNSSTSSSCTGNSATATTAASCTGNSATATTAASCTGNSATATTAASCTGNSATASTASTVSNGAITAAKLDGAQSGDAPIFGVRAWANINGTVGSVSVRQGGNVSGVVRDQLGRYTITFVTPMQDTNYAIVAWARDTNATDNNYFVSAASNATKLTGSFQIEVNSPGGTVDSPEIGVMVIR